MGDQGWICLHRQLLDSPLATRPAYNHVWVTILLLASHKQSSFIWNGARRTVKTGQLLTGRRKLAERTGLSQSMVERVLKYLEIEQQIEQQKTTKFRIITILNWDKYQVNGCGEQHIGQQVDNKRTTDGHIQQCNNENKQLHCQNSPPKATESQCMENFNAARKIYPGTKRGLAVEFKNFQKKHTDWRDLLDDDGFEQCVCKLIRDKAYSNGYWPMFQTFCNQSRYEEAIEE